MSDENGKGNRGASGIPGMEMAVGGKSRNLRGAYGSFFRYIEDYKQGIFLAAALSVAGAVLNLAGPNKLSEVTDLIAEGIHTAIDIPAILKIVSYLAVLYCIGFLLNYIQGYIMATLAQNISRNMRFDISVKINRLPLRYFDSTSVGDVLSRVTNDVDTVGQTMNQSFSTLASSIAMLLGSAVMMFLTNGVMAFVGILAALTGFAVMLGVVSKSQSYFMQQQTELGGVTSYVEEILNGHIVVKAYNGERKAKNEFHKRNDQLYECAWNSQFLSSLMVPLLSFIGNLAYVAVCVTGAVLTMKGSISFGTVVAFMLYIRLFTQPLQNISQALNSVQSMAAACERVFEFLGEKEMEDESWKTAKPVSVRGDITFEHVKFGYYQEKIIIHDFTRTVQAGQKIAIVGPTGAGKTTLVNLLMRFYELNGGKITIDGIPIAEMKRETVHSLFGMVLQDTWLFEGTVRENLVYGKENVTDEELDKICDAAGISELVRILPEGYDTMLGDQDNLSAGQKQLFTIARAMVKNAPLLILDEATSSVDTRTEQKVQKAMETLMKGRTSFVIAHRLSTIKNADCILVLKNGDVIEGGTHEELLKQDGFYADLYYSQFEQTL